MTTFNINPETDLFNVEECEGTLIRATMRSQDLIPCFLEAISNTIEYTQLVVNNAGIPSHAQDDEDAEWWYSEDASFLVEELFDVLNNYAPEGYYFGSHPGDGSDYGYWSCDDDE